MKKIIWFPIWKIDELEKRLSEYEENGYRVSEVKYSYFYSFKEVVPQKIDYYVSYTALIKMNTRDTSMLECDRYVKGGKIPTKHCTYSLRRTREDEKKMDFIRGARMDYIKSVLMQKMLLWFAFFIMFFLFMFLDMNKMTDSRFAFYILCLSITLFYFCFYLLGFIKQIKKCGEFEKSNK